MCFAGFVCESQKRLWYLQWTMVGPLEGGASSRALSTFCTSSRRGGALSGVFWSGQEVYQYCRRLRSSPSHYNTHVNIHTNMKIYPNTVIQRFVFKHEIRICSFIQTDTDVWYTCCSTCKSKSSPWYLLLRQQWMLSNTALKKSECYQRVYNSVAFGVT